jgi:hypothetical protein
MYKYVKVNNGIIMICMYLVGKWNLTTPVSTMTIMEVKMNKKLFKTGALALSMIALSLAGLQSPVMAGKSNVPTTTTTQTSTSTQTETPVPAATSTTPTSISTQISAPSKTNTTVKPIFSSSFIQYWFAQDWTLERWQQEFTMLKEIGINEIILQNIADTKIKETAYKTSMAGYISNDIDMLENALTAADNIGISVRMGLGFNGDWWNKNASDAAWLQAEVNTNKAIINEIVAKYGSHPSFKSWYIPYEFSQFTARTTTTQTNLNNFFKQIVVEIDAKKSGDVMVAPFYNGKFSWMTPVSSWSTMLQNILKGTGVDIIALQDSVGAGYNTLTQVTSLFSYSKKAASAIGMKLYADTETFTSTSNGNVSAPQSRIASQFSSEKAYVEGFVAFSVNHYQNKNVSTQLTNYNDYLKYYVLNK